MKCPYCLSTNSSVIDSRLSQAGTIRRRRECSECHRRFSTIEMLELHFITVIKKNGKKEQFAEDKLHLSVDVALSGIEIDDEEKENFLTRITSYIYRTAAENKNTISTAQIGEVVLSELKTLSPVAYVRFASAYKDFSNVKQFIDEIKRLK